MGECGRQNIPPIVAALLAAAALIGSAAILKHVEMAPAGRVLVALAPLPFYVALFVTCVRMTRRLDELKQRIQLEALAYAVIGMLLSTATYGWLLKADVGISPLGWDWVWVVTVIFYILGTVIGWRRYR